MKSRYKLTDPEAIDELRIDLLTIGFDELKYVILSDLAARRGSIEGVLASTEVDLMCVDGVGTKTMKIIRKFIRGTQIRQNILDAKLEDRLLTPVSDKLIQDAIWKRRIMAEHGTQELIDEVRPKPIVDAIMLRRDIYEQYGMPEYKTVGSAGMDLRACIDDPIELQPNEVKMIPSGLKIHVVNPDYAAILLPRSGLGAKHGIVLGNLVGLIDSDYQGEMGMSVWNRSNTPHIINPGDRVAQMVVIRVEQVCLNFVESFEATERGEGGFGSTGHSDHPRGQTKHITPVDEVPFYPNDVPKPY